MFLAYKLYNTNLGYYYHHYSLKNYRNNPHTIIEKEIATYGDYKILPIPYGEDNYCKKIFFY
jgi:hypothetical protein